MSGVSLVFGTNSDSLSLLESPSISSPGCRTGLALDYNFGWDPNGALGGPGVDDGVSDWERTFPLTGSRDPASCPGFTPASLLDFEELLSLFKV